MGPASPFTESGLPVVRGLVVVEASIAISRCVIRDQRIDRVSGSRLELLLAVVDDVAALALVVLQGRPGNRVILLSHPKEAAKADDGEHDVIGRLVQDDVL